MLQPDVVHPEEECRQQGEDHHAHRALAVYGVMHMHATTLRGRVRDEQEGLEAIEDRLQGREATTLSEGWLDLIDLFS